MSDPAPKQTVTVLCETHGLRYNPNQHSGCIRCRKEAGQMSGASSPSSSSSLVVALAVAFVLIFGSATLFFQGHKATFEAAKEARELWMKDESELTPEQREQLLEFKKQLEQFGVSPDQ